ncbi:MAG: hypothetical protein LBE76_05780 [Nitrososphaerota archaeon]|jgi:asparagine synthase (glutamine-hydrolysing)|nr:hypothetical protein [Nitrososphaerota archaeon]
MRTTIAVLNRRGKPALPTAIGILKNNKYSQSLNFTVADTEKMISHKKTETPNRQNINSQSIIGYSYTEEAKKSYSFLQSNKVAIVFEGTIYEPITKEEALQEIIKKPSCLEAQLQTIIEKTEGNYLLLVLKDEEIIAIRDPMGVQPLYFGENTDVAAFASNRKSLWQLGIDKVESFPPGNLGLLTNTGFRFKPIKTFTYTEPKQSSIDEATEKLQNLLEHAVKMRIAGLKEVAVAFSGGLDSSLIAYIANKCGVKVDLIHVSLENEPETKTAIEASKKLNLPIQLHLFKESDVENTLPLVVDLIEEPDPVKTAIGVPLYWTALKTREAGHTVLLTGHGADELFGGYQRYINEYCKEGTEKVRQTIFNDVTKNYKTNLERDKKICINTDIKLLLPFCSFDLAEFALSLPTEMKIEQSPISLRKLLLRKVALNMGLPASIANKPKKAVQYSTGINNAIKRIAQKNNQTVNEYITKRFQKITQH